MKKMTFTHILSAMAMAASALSSAPASAYSGLFIFGDSISDSGNVAAFTAQQAGFPVYSPLPTDNSFVPSLAYGPYGTFSNGLAWTTKLAGMLGLSADPFYLGTGGTNFAFGGARVSGPNVSGAHADHPVGLLPGRHWRVCAWRCAVRCARRCQRCP